MQDNETEVPVSYFVDPATVTAVASVISTLISIYGAILDGSRDDRLNKKLDTILACLRLSSLNWRS